MAFLKPKLNNGSIVVTCTACGTVVPEKVSECPVCSDESRASQASAGAGLDNTAAVTAGRSGNKYGEDSQLEDSTAQHAGDKSSHSKLATLNDLINEHNVSSGDQIQAAPGGKTTSLENIAKASLNTADIKAPREVVSPAPFRARLIAAIVDHTFIYATTFFLFLLFAFPVQQYVMTGHSLASFEILLARQMGVIAAVAGLYWLAVILVPMLYYSWFESSSARGTPGKLLMGLRIVPLHSTKIGFWQASLKFGMQMLLLYFIAIVAALSALAFAAIGGQNMTNPIVSALEFVLVASAFCLPVFKGKSQTLLDLLSRRMVIPKAMLPNYLHQASLFVPPEEPVDAKRVTYSKSRLADAVFWLVFGLIGFVAGAIGLMVTTKFEVMLGILAASVIIPFALRKFFASKNISRILETSLKAGVLIALGAGGLLLIPYNIELWSGIASSVPLAEKAFAIDPTLQKPEAKAFVEQAKRVFRDVDFPYAAGATALRGLGFTQSALPLSEKYAALSNNPDRHYFNLGELYEEAGRIEEAIAAYGKVAAMKPSKTVSSSLISDANSAINRLRLQKKMQ